MGQDWRHKEFILSVHDKDCIRAFDFWAMSIFSLHSWLHIFVEWMYARRGECLRWQDENVKPQFGAISLKFDWNLVPAPIQ